MYCRNCGTKNDATDKFCKNCGTPLEKNQNKKESKFETIAKKKSNPVFIIIGIIIIVAVLYVGRQLPEYLMKQETELVTFSGYSLEIPLTYQAVVNNDTLTIMSDSFEEQEAIGIRIYATGYEELVSELKELASTDNSISNLETEKYENEEYVIAEYDIGNYKGAVALKKAEDDNVFWVQTVSPTSSRGREILQNFVPVIATAKKTGTTTSEVDGEISMSITNKLKEEIVEIF